MFRRYAKGRFPYGLLTALVLMAALLCACSSTPAEKSNKESASQAETKSASKSNNKADKDAIVEPEVPAGPPPIPPEATQAFERAVTLLSGGDIDASIKEFQRLSDTYPDYAGPQINLGIAYAKRGKLPDAEKALQSATKRGEPNAAAFNQLGIVYRKLGRFKDADAAYSEALRIDPSYALAHLNLGVLCDMYLQQPQRALTELERYLQLATAPDPRVSAWVKELQGRVGKKPAAQSPNTPSILAVPDTNSATSKEPAGT
jgi:tetratricopeptide (TPR) repeat protein